MKTNGAATVRLTARIPASLDQKLFDFAQSLAGPGGKPNVSDALREILESAFATNGHARVRECALQFEDDVVSVADNVDNVEIRRHVHIDSLGADVDLIAFDPIGRGRIIEIKSVVRRDRLVVAMGQGIIAKEKSGLPVTVVVPYLLPDAEELSASFRSVGIDLVTISELYEYLSRWRNGHEGE